MGRRKKHDVKIWERETLNDNKFVRLYSSMLTSKAYVNLSSEAKVLYTLLKNNYYGSGETAMCPYDDIVKYTGINRKRIRKRIDELVAYGFIKISVQEEKNKRGKPPNIYHFVKDWQNKTDEDIIHIKNKLTENDERKEKARQRIREMIESENIL